MQNATVTVRELKNKNSGVDLNIPTYNQTSGMLGSTVEYMVVVVTNLDVFKLPKHKHTDTIQFTIGKKFSDFEDVYKKLNEKFSGTALPPLPRKVLLKSDAVYRERRIGLEHFLKFLAVVPKLVTSGIFLEFLGVKASKVIQVSSEDKTQQEGETEEGESEEERGKKENLDVFGEGETENELFIQDGDDGEDDDIFGDTHITTERAAMFDVPDLGGGLQQDEEDLILPSARIERHSTKTEEMTEEEKETSELLNLDDDFEEILKMTTRKHNSSSASEKNHKPIPAPRKLKPSVPAKPNPGIPSKPHVPRKPTVAPRTSKGENSCETTTKGGNSAETISNSDQKTSNIPNKRADFDKTTSNTPTKGDNSDGTPSNTPTKGDNSDNTPIKGDNSDTTTSSEPAELSNDDIMKYISENSSVDADLDLF